MTAMRNMVILGSSRMMGNYHVRFLEEGNPVRGCPYSTVLYSSINIEMYFSCHIGIFFLKIFQSLSSG